MSAESFRRTLAQGRKESSVSLRGSTKKEQEKGERREAVLSTLIKEAQGELSREWKYEVQRSKRAACFADSYVLKVSSAKVKREHNSCGIDDAEAIVRDLQEHLDAAQESAAAARDKVAGICAERRREAERLAERINGKLEEPFRQEDARIQSAVRMVREGIGRGGRTSKSEGLEWISRRAMLALAKSQRYSLVSRSE